MSCLSALILSLQCISHIVHALHKLMETLTDSKSHTNVLPTPYSISMYCTLPTKLLN